MTIFFKTSLNSLCNWPQGGATGTVTLWGGPAANGPRIIVVFLSAVWTLILTAPIYCKGSAGAQVM